MTICSGSASSGGPLPTSGRARCCLMTGRSGLRCWWSSIRGDISAAEERGEGEGGERERMRAGLAERGFDAEPVRLNVSSRPQRPGPGRAWGAPSGEAEGRRERAGGRPRRRMLQTSKCKVRRRRAARPSSPPQSPNTKPPSLSPPAAPARSSVFEDFFFSSPVPLSLKKERKRTSSLSDLGIFFFAVSMADSSSSSSGSAGASRKRGRGTARTRGEESCCLICLQPYALGSGRKSDALNSCKASPDSSRE